jgi:hypothetical protein
LSSLLELQREIRSVLLETDARVPSLIRGDDAADRLAIYRNTIRGTLAKTLRLSYPTVERLVGAEFFDGAAAIFCDSHPAESADLNAYDVRFPAFLEALPQCAHLAYLGDVARLDWAVSRALHAPDVTPVAPSALAATGDDAHELCFISPPCLSLLRSAFPVHEIWQAVLARDDMRLAAIDLTSGPVYLIVQRPANEVEVVTMDASEWRFTEALFAGTPLGAALEVADIEAAGCLARHLAAGRIAAISAANREKT